MSLRPVALRAASSAWRRHIPVAVPHVARMSSSSSPAWCALHGKGGRLRVRKMYSRRLCASTLPTATEASTLPYVDTHCHLDLIFEKMNARSVGGKTADKSGMPAPGSVHHASWLHAVRTREKNFVLQNGVHHTRNGIYESTGASVNTVSPKLEACVTVACSAKAHGRIRKMLIDVDPTFTVPEGVFAAFGCHPLSAKDWEHENLHSATRDLLINHPDKVVAIGECGLDYCVPLSGRVINGSGERETAGDAISSELSNQEKDKHELQHKTFVAQMKMSDEFNKPIVIHTREAESDTLRLMKENLRQDAAIHVHCFTSQKWFAEELLKHFPNLCLGFTGVVTFKNAEAVVEVVKITPLHRILLETDGPYMAPTPKRGEIAHPGHVPYVALKIAEIKGVAVGDVLVAARDATRRIYGI